MGNSLLTQLSGRILGAVLDPTIVLSFDHTGFLVHQTQFRAEDLEVNMRGKTCLVTGANSGLGLATARALAQHGAKVWLLCRDEERGRAAVDEIRRESDDGQARLEVLDVSNLSAIRRFAETFDEPAVDVLINNAGILTEQRSETAEGIELTLATNLVGPFLLTYLLLPRLRRSPAARVINVSSGGMYTQKLVVDELSSADEPFDGVVSYARTKRAVVVLTELWAEKLSGNVTFNAMHPGWADTAAVRRSLPLFYKVLKPLLRTPEEGADTIVWLALCPRIADQTGMFWFDREARRTHFAPWTRESPEERERLWELCCRLCEIDPAAELP